MGKESDRFVWKRKISCKGKIVLDRPVQPSWIPAKFLVIKYE